VAGPPKSPAQTRLLLVEDVGQVSRYIRGVLNAQTAIKLLDVVSDGAIVIEQIREQQPDVLVVDALLTGKMNGLQVAESVRKANLDLPIIVLTVPQKPIVVGGGMGIARVLEMPFTGYDFMNLLAQVTAEHRAKSPEALSRIITFHGAKGGVGTSTLAYNTAVAMARPHVHRVAFVDGNLQFSDVRTLLQVPPDTHSINDLPTDRMTQAEISEAMWADPNGIDVLFGPPRMEDAEMVTIRDLEKTLSLLRRMYNVVVIDTSRAVSDVTLACFDAADVIMQVTVSEVPALYQTARMAATLQAIGYGPDKVRLVVNRHDAPGALDDNAIRRYLGRAADFKVSNDAKLALDAANKGQSLVAANPQAKMAHEIKALARMLSEALPAPPPRPVAA
jgi:pilus assembly protein CpaE